MPEVNATTCPSRTSPATGSEPPGGMKVASLMARRLDGLPILGERRSPGTMPSMDTSAITAAAKASSANYRSFADATRAVLDLLERHMPEATLFLAHLDRGQFIHRIVDTRKGGEFGLRSNLATPLADAFCSHMAEDRAPRLCDDVPKQPIYAGLGDAAPHGRRLLPRRPAGALRRHARRLAGRAQPRVLRLRARRRAALHHARPRARLRAGAREQRARPAPLQRHAARPGARDGRRRPRGQGARRRRRRAHAPSARRPARSRARRSRSCSSRPAASSPRRRWPASRSRP